MGVHHLISIDESELRNWKGEHDDLLRNIGAAVVLACMDPTTPSISVGDNKLGPEHGASCPLISINHVDAFESEEDAPTLDVWAWSIGESLFMADLTREDMELLMKFTYAVRTGQVKRRETVERVDG